MPMLSPDTVCPVKVCAKSAPTPWIRVPLVAPDRSMLTAAAPAGNAIDAQAAAMASEILFMEIPLIE